EICATARAQRWDPAEVLRVLFLEEIAGRDLATRRMRRRAAGFPSGKTFDSWRREDSSIPTPTQQALMTLEWVGRAENLAICGPTARPTSARRSEPPSSRRACAWPGSRWSRSLQLSAGPRS